MTNSRPPRGPVSTTSDRRSRRGVRPQRVPSRTMPSGALGYVLFMSGPRLGRAIEVRGPVFELGRSSSAHLQLLDEEVSQHHASIEWADGHLILCDQRSSNGTWLGKQRVEPSQGHRLTSGDRFRLGTTELRFVSIDDTHEVALIHQIGRDRLTGALEWGQFQEVVQESLSGNQWSVSLRPHLLGLFQVQNLASLTDTHGRSSGDKALQRLANHLRGALPAAATFGRDGATLGAFFPPPDTHTSVKQTLDELERAVGEAFSGESGTKGVSACGAVVTLIPTTEAIGEAMQRCEALLFHAARRSSGGLLTDQQPEFHRMGLLEKKRKPHHPLLFREFMARLQNGAPTLVAFEVLGERHIVSKLGPPGYREAVYDLTQLVGRLVPEGGCVGWLHERYVLAVISDERQVGPLVAKVRRQWKDLKVAEALGKKPELELRFAVLPPKRWRELGERLADELPAQLLAEAEPAGGRGAELPMPLELLLLVPRSLEGEAAAQPTLNALELAAKFFTAWELGALRSLHSPAADVEVASVLGQVHRPQGVSFGEWSKLAWELALRLQKFDAEGTRFPLPVMVERGAPAPLARLLLDAVKPRNDRSHSKVLVARDGPAFAHGLREEIDRVAPELAAIHPWKMVSGHEVSSDDAGQVKHRLRALHGASGFFPIIDSPLSHPLHKRWCSMVRLDTAQVVQLTPFLGTYLCHTCGRQELGVAHGLPDRPPGAEVELRDPVSGHRGEGFVTPP